jgi:hypothetical protein
MIRLPLQPARLSDALFDKPDPTEPSEPIMPPGYHKPIERIPRWKTALNLVAIALAVALLAYSVGPTLIEMIDYATGEI